MAAGCIKVMASEVIDKVFNTRDIMLSDGPENTCPALEQSLPLVDQLCKARGHLTGKVGLAELIKQDSEKLAAAGFERDDVLWMYRFMRATHVRHSSYTVTDDNVRDLVKLLRSHEPHWSLQSATQSRMTFNGHTFEIVCLVWGGAEECPFDNILSPAKYFGYEYGDRDWLVLRDRAAWLTFGDLVPNQGGKYGFFQDSKHRLEPVEFLRFFGYQRSQRSVIQGCLTKTRGYRFICSPSPNYRDTESLKKAILDHKKKEFAESYSSSIVVVGVNISNAKELRIGTVKGMEMVQVKLDRPVADGYIQYLDIMSQAVFHVDGFISVAAIFQNIWTLK